MKAKKGCSAFTPSPVRRRTANTLTAFLSIAALASGAPAAEVYRFLDTTTVSVTSMGIDGVYKRVLNPFRSAEIFALPKWEGTPTLSFSIGQQPTPSGGTIRFEIEVERDGKWVPIYAKDLSEPKWIDERITLPADTPRVRLRRKMLSGTKEQAEKSAFGDPVLLPPRPTKRPSVILISLDTLRADRLGLHGYKPARTPVLDAFGKSGIWYTHAYSPSAWTLPSHASLFYGFSLPSVPLRTDVASKHRATYSQAPALAEILRGAGYLTAGFTGGGYLAPSFAFDRGFDTYYAFPQNHADKDGCTPQRFDGPEVFRRGTEWLRDRGRAPFFLFLHTYDVHDRCPFQPKDLPSNLPWIRLDDAGYARLLAYYDDLIAETDARVGTFLAELDALGLRDGTLVIITSDHGELFKEHGQEGHSCNNDLYEPLVRVPLMMRFPSRIKPAPPRPEPVALVDVAPTILQLLGVPQPSTMSAAPLPGLRRDVPESARAVLVTCDHQVAVRQGALKLIASQKPTDPPRLFDIERDPGEKENLYTPEKAAPLQRIAEQHWKDASLTPPEAPREIDPETKERLRALGYNP